MKQYDYTYEIKNSIFMINTIITAFGVLLWAIGAYLSLFANSISNKPVVTTLLVLQLILLIEVLIAYLKILSIQKSKQTKLDKILVKKSFAAFSLLSLLAVFLSFVLMFVSTNTNAIALLFYGTWLSLIASWFFLRHVKRV